MTQSPTLPGMAPKVVNRPHIEIRPLRSGGHRVVFLYPYKAEFAAAARALKIRGYMLFGKNPLPGRYDYMAFYADIRDYSAETYAAYAMLVRDFYGDDIQAKFNALFPHVDHRSVKATIHNPNAYMEAQRPVVEALLEKYKNTRTPLEFYDSKHMAEGVAMILAMLKHPELKGFILADEQGMAKTLQVIIAAIEAGLRRVLIVSTKSGSDISWPDEIMKAQDHPRLYRGGPDRLGPNSMQWVILSWNDISRFAAIEHLIKNRKRKPETPELPGVERALQDVKDMASQFDLLVLDEGHYAQDQDSQRSIAADCFARFIPHVIPVTGTPVAKRPKNVYNLLRMIGHPLAKDKDAFLARYQAEKDKDDEGNSVMPQRYEELHHLLQDAYIRREKSQTNLPPKIRPVKKIFFTDEDFKAMDDMWEQFKKDNAEEMKKDSYPVDIVKQGKYYEFAAIRKAPHVADWAEDHTREGNKVTLFTNCTEVYEYWMKRFGDRAAGINGDVENRKAQEHKFQTDPKCMFFCGNIIAAGESITLTAGYILGFNDITNRPKDQLQAEDRNHRGGQTQDCEANYFVANTKEDQERFDRFVNDKEVIQSIANRRNADGTITDAAWTGETEGTAAAHKSKLIKTAFDWEDAGEEPPKVVKPKETLKSMPAYRQKMIKTANAKRAAKKAGIQAATDDNGLASQLRIIVKFLGSPKEADFCRSLIKWNLDQRTFTPKQKDAAIKIVERNIHRLAEPT